MRRNVLKIPILPDLTIMEGLQTMNIGITIYT